MVVVLFTVGLVSRQHLLLAGLISAFRPAARGAHKKITKVPQTLKFLKLQKVNQDRMATVVNN